MSAEILVVDDEQDIRELVEQILTEEGFAVTTAANAEEARLQQSELNPDLILLDIWMPDVDGISLLKEWSLTGTQHAPVVMMSGHGTVETAVEATRLGAYDFIEKPLSMAKLLSTVEKALNEARPVVRKTTQNLIPPLIEPIGKSITIQKARNDAKRIAEQDANTLIVGEPGTGREAFARYIHSLSETKTGPFVNLVPSAIHDDELFKQLKGYIDEDGKFHSGLFHQAQGGVLFINELEDVSTKLQRLLNGVIEKDSFNAIDSDKSEAINFRIISSARPGFEHRVSSLGFRDDLLQTLNVLRLHIPPLRDYLEDVPQLLRYYVDVLVEEHQLPFHRFTIAAQNRLRNYDWPGNMRQLKNVVYRLLTMSEGADISPTDAEAVLAVEPAMHTGMLKEDWLTMPIRKARDAFEKAYLEHQLKLCEGKVGALAKKVGMERTHLYRKLKSLGIEFGRNKE